VFEELQTLRLDTRRLTDAIDPRD